MKYIRTKDGAIYKIEDNNLIFNGNKIPIDINKLGKDYKVADTIEELCDEFVRVKEDWHYIENRIIALNNWKRIIAEKETLFGAIWTDKGLIYVAKMNENGELELI